MNREDIIRMAREAAAMHGHTIKATDEIVETLTSFAFLVKSKAWLDWCELDLNGQVERTHYNAGYIAGADAEREACAKVCESRQTPGTGSVAILNGAADAIRARGQE